MSVGSTVRAMFGRHERLVSDVWRSGFIDLDHFVSQIQEWVPAPARILEIGCGEGAGTERLAAAFPKAEVLAIDIASNLGRLYGGRDAGVTFRQMTAQELADEQPGAFDLIVLCDVLHHVPTELRSGIIESIRLLLSPSGSFVFKDWERRQTPIHWATHAADRWLTGDDVHYLTLEEARTLIASHFSPAAVRAETQVRPWSHNYMFLLCPAPQPSI
jgi:2-polyprenyl-6-hydroxyphenyl methylase/3-demethylubiquinone-9 3-methyltransferase